MLRPLGSLAIALVAAGLLASCGLDCEEYCEKMEDCNDNRCDNNRCEDFCDDALSAGSSIGWEDQAQCAIDASCTAIREGACFEGDAGIRWCRE